MVRTPLACLAIIAACSSSGWAQETKTAPLESPVGQLALAIGDLATKVRVEDAPFVRYLSAFTVPAEQRADFRRVFRFWLGHMSTAKTTIKEVEVAGSNATLWRIDLRDSPNWTIAAWNVVGNRDYLFREPLLPHRETEFLRQSLGIKQDAKTLAAVGVLNAQQLYRDALEGNRSTTYYDLLYAADRFPDGDVQFAVIPGAVGVEPIKPALRPWPGGAWTGDDADKGKVFAPGAFDYIPRDELKQWEAVVAVWRAQQRKDNTVLPIVGQSAKKGNANFPATDVEFEAKWGADADAVKKLVVDPRVGGIGQGSLESPNAGSFVALRTRAVRITPTAFGQVTRTFDVFKVAGDKDHMERFGQIAKGQVAFDGSEILATLPNGAQAGFLCGADGKRVEIAPSDLAQVDSKIDKYKDVRTHMSCVVCHLPSGGFINFAEQYRANIQAGLDLSAEDRQKQKQVEDFYLSWSRKVKLWQEPYLIYLQDTTATEKEPKGWTPAKAVSTLQKFRDDYDASVTLDVAAREMGVTPEQLKFAILNVRPIKTRPNQLAIGRSIPREAWENDVAFEVALILDTAKDVRGEPLKRLIAPELLQDALKKFSKGK